MILKKQDLAATQGLVRLSAIAFPGDLPLFTMLVNRSLRGCQKPGKKPPQESKVNAPDDSASDNVGETTRPGFQQAPHTMSGQDIKK